MTRLEAARVLRPDGSLRPGAVVWAGDRIQAVEDIPPGAHPDRTLIPGLIDLQVNGYADVDVATGSADALDALDHRLATAGTTAWCPTLTSRPLDWYAGWFADHPRPVAGEIGVHLEGPFIARPGAHRPEVLRAPDAGWIAELPSRVALVTLAPELPGAMAAIGQLSPHRVVALGHSEATFAQAQEAAGCGATLVTHVFNAMPGLHHREPGLVGAALARHGLTPAVIGDGVHVHAAILRLVLDSGPAVIVTDSVAWENRPALVVERGAARLHDGTLAGSVITAAEALRTAVGAGVGLADGLAALTATPARIMRRADLGIIAPGARADVVELDPALQVTRVWRGGQPVEGR